MKASVRNKAKVETIEIGVADVADIDISEAWHRKARIIRPDQAEIRVVDGRTQIIEVTGYILLKSGQLSLETRGKATWYGNDGLIRTERINSAPAWVRMLWEEAPQGETDWVSSTSL